MCLIIYIYVYIYIYIFIYINNTIVIQLYDTVWQNIISLLFFHCLYKAYLFRHGTKLQWHSRKAFWPVAWLQSCNWHGCLRVMRNWRNSGWRPCWWKWTAEYIGYVESFRILGRIKQVRSAQTQVLMSSRAFHHWYKSYIVLLYLAMDRAWWKRCKAWWRPVVLNLGAMEDWLRHGGETVLFPRTKARGKSQAAEVEESLRRRRDPSTGASSA